ncbi:dentin sialophosphoprotein isoform X2 [Anopheles stephensi]|uniref:dentin sialophosphoprotein isoform X2 n=1 Tax=Anopheles stephensi TaxID=30069 RepID=UPI001658819C|nr:dentin sialophosphoprotein isoform X2 [Anopheles stephensi]
MGTLTTSSTASSFPLVKSKIAGTNYEEETTETRSMTERSGRTDSSGRSAALERAYVHDVYENCEEPNGQIRPKVAQFLGGLEPGSLVCDVGCGNGRYLSGFNPLIYTIGVDRCYRLTQVAHGKGGEVAICDNLELPFRDESFDAVLSLAVVHHFATTERRVGAIRELARILRIGGRVIITVWALEQRHRRFESQDVLVPWQPPRTKTGGISDDEDDDDFLPPYHAYTEDSTNSSRSAGDGDSSSLSSSSPGETCYSFVRRAIQKLAGSKRSPWFLESWSSRETKHDSSLDYEDAKDLPIELRRLEDFDDLPEPPLSAGLKSRSLGSILNPPPKTIVRSRSSVPSLGAQIPESKATPAAEPTPVSRRPKLVKQKQSLCDDVDYKFTESSAQAYREHALRNESRVQLLRKQSSLNEELMAESRLREKERIRKRIQKQISLNESFLCRSLFTKRLQVIKEGFATKLKTSTGSLERVTKNGFVKIIQNIKAATPAAYHGGPAGSSGTGGGHPHHHHHHHPYHHHHHPHHHHHHHHQPHHQHHASPHGAPSGRPPYCYEPGGDCGPCPGGCCLAGMHPEHGGTGRYGGSTGGHHRLSRNNSASGSGTSSNGSNGNGINGNGSNGNGSIGHDKLLASMGSSQDEASKPRRHSRESGSDSSKDSSLQSDTSIESEDSFASVIYIPKPDQQQQPTQQQQQVQSNGGCGVVAGGSNGSSACSGGNGANGGTNSVSDFFSPGAAINCMPSSSVPTSPLVMPCPTPAHSPAPPRTKSGCVAAASEPADGHTSFSSVSNGGSNQFTFEETVILPWQLEQQESTVKEPTATSDAPMSNVVPAVRDTSACSKSTSNSSTTTTTTASSTCSGKAAASSGTGSRRNSNQEGVSPQKAGSQSKITRQQIKDLPPIPKFRRSGNYPILRRQTSAAAGTSTAAPVPVPKLLSLELFNPETDDLDSDSSEPSSPDSIDSVISALRPSLSPLPATGYSANNPHKPHPSGSDASESAAAAVPVGVPSIPPLVEAAAVVAHKLEDVVDMAIPERLGADGKPLRFNGLLNSTTSSTALHIADVDEHNSRQQLVDFAEKLSAQLLKELENEKKRNESFDEDDDVFGVDSRVRPAIGSPPIIDPYLKKLNGDLRDLNQLRAELRERRLMLANLSNMGSGVGLSGQFGGSNDSLGPSYGSSMAPIIQEETDDDEEFNELEDRRCNGVESGQPAGGSSALKVTSSIKCKNLGGKTVDDFVIIPELDEDDPELSNDTALLIQEEDSSEEHLHTSAGGATVHGAASGSTLDSYSRRCKVPTYASAKPLAGGDSQPGGSSSSSNSSSSKDTATDHCSRWNNCVPQQSIAPHSTTLTTTTTTTTATMQPSTSSTLAAGLSTGGTGPSAHIPGPPSTAGLSICGERKPLSATKKSSMPSFESHASVDSWAHSTSTASLDSPSIGGSATHHRYYHVFREGELDALINHHVTSLHIVSSYYERASWCVVAEKVHVWTI